jgi:hypothetical protein
MGPWIRPVLVDVRRGEVGFRIDGSLNADGTAREAGEAKTGRVALQFLASFVHEVGGAEQTDACCRYVLGLKLDGAEHSGGVLKRPGNVAVSDNPHRFASPCRLALSGAGSIGSTKSALQGEIERLAPESQMTWCLVSLFQTRWKRLRVLPRVMELVLNPVRNAAELIDRQSGDVRGPVMEQRLTLTVGVVGAVAKATTASRLTGLSISEIGSSSTEQGLGAAAVCLKFRDCSLFAATGRAVALRSTSLGLIDGGSGLANSSFGTLTSRSKVRNGGLFSLVRTCFGSTTDLPNTIAPSLRGGRHAVHAWSYRRDQAGGGGKAWWDKGTLKLDQIRKVVDPACELMKLLLGIQVHSSDHCLFLRHDCIVICFIDDTLILTKDPKVADSVIEGLRNAGLDLDKESTSGNIANYLGIEIRRERDGTLVLTQKGLIKRILEAMSLESANPKDTPAIKVLGSFKDSPPFSGSYNYRSVVGMMMYLTSSTCPDCAFAIHQCARFSHDPREAHASALKRLACYLKKTMNDGLRIRPDKRKLHSLHLWADADFAGVWGKEDPQDPTCVRSRTGVLVTLGDTPVFWSSKLQSKTALSTMEAEYIALSTGMRTLLHLRHILRTSVPSSPTPRFRSIPSRTSPMSSKTIFAALNAARATAFPPSCPRRPVEAPPPPASSSSSSSSSR